MYVDDRELAAAHPVDDAATDARAAAAVHDLCAGEPAANGERNVILGDLNTDPGRTFDFDESAALWNEHVGDGKRFHFLTDVGPDATPTSALFNIDHAVSDVFDGSCWHAGVTPGKAAVSEIVYFDHKPVVCTLDGP